MKGRKPDRIVSDSGALRIAPRAPAWLSKDAAAEWKRVVPLLVERRILTLADLGNVENYCSAIGTVREMERHIQEHGHVVETASGLKRNPAVAIQADAMTRARLLAAELGLTPVSRSRPAIREAGDDADDPLNLS